MTRPLATFIISVANALDDIWVPEDSSLREAIQDWALKKWQTEYPDEKNAQYIGTAQAKVRLTSRQDLGTTFEVEVYDPTYD